MRTWPCVRCSAATDPYFHIESGGLCGDCLADEAIIPLTRIAPSPPPVETPYRGRDIKPGGFWKKGSGC